MIFKFNLFVQQLRKISELEHSVSPVAFCPHKNSWMPTPAIKGNAVVSGLIKAQEVSIFTVEPADYFVEFLFSFKGVRGELMKLSIIEKLFPIIQRTAFLRKSTDFIASLNSASGYVGDIRDEAIKRFFLFHNQLKADKKFLEILDLSRIVKYFFGCLRIERQRFEQRLKAGSEHVTPKQRKENRIDIHVVRKKIQQTRPFYFYDRS